MSRSLLCWGHDMDKHPVFHGDPYTLSDYCMICGGRRVPGFQIWDGKKYINMKWRNKKDLLALNLSKLEVALNDHSIKENND